MNDTKPRDRMGRIARFLIPVSWTLWGILMLVLLWAFVDSIANPVHTPEVSAQVGPMMMGALLIVFIGFGLLIRWTRSSTLRSSRPNSRTSRTKRALMLCIPS